MKTLTPVIASLVFVATALPAHAQIPPVVPTDVTGIGPGSPGSPMLQMQLDTMMGQPQRTYGIATTRTQARVIPRWQQQNRYIIYRDPATGLQYLLPF